ncbi:MAG: glycosyltransferase 4 family protein [Candidatus Micrarchaeia archaeon]
MALIELSHPFILTGIVSFIATLFVTWLLIPRMKRAGFTAVDLNKVPTSLSTKEIKELKEKGSKNLPTFPRAGGIAIIFGIEAGMLFSLAVFPYNQIAFILAAMLSITLIGAIGVIEDFLHIRQFYRVLLPAVAALPLMAVSAGTSKMTLPLLGTIEFGLFYPLVLIPIGVMAASNLINLLAGFNGLEAGTGAIVGMALFTVAYLNGNSEASLISIALTASCVAFLVFNWFPAKVFPGNSATYLIGAAIAATVIVGNMERVGAIALTPQIIEFFLKAKSRFKAENFGRIDKNGRLNYSGPTHSLSHFLMKHFKPTEQQLVIMLLAIQAVFAVLAIASAYL